MASRFFPIGVVWLGLIVVGFASCDRRTPTAAPIAAAVPPPCRTPLETAKRLADLHRRGAYDEMEELIVPDAREATLALIRGVDEVLSANRYLKQIAERVYRGPASETWGLEPMANNVGLFSKNISIISQSFVGEKGIVTLQEGDNVPLFHAEFEQVDGRWLFRPEPTPRAMERELRRLAEVLWSLCSEVNSGLTVDRFVGEFTRRVRPQMHRVVRARDEPSMIAAGKAEP